MARYLIEGTYVDGETYRKHLEKENEKLAAQTQKAEKETAAPKKASN